MKENSGSAEARKYRWPWFVLAFFLLGVLLAVLWVSQEARRIQRLKVAVPEAVEAAPGKP